MVATHSREAGLRSMAAVRSKGGGVDVDGGGTTMAKRGAQTT
jgi:hypothetical protein